MVIFLRNSLINFVRIIVFACILGIFTAIWFCSLSLAGNSWMMEKMGQNLIKLNKEVVEKIVSAKNNSEIFLKAKVIQGIDKNILLIEKVELSSLTKTENIFKDDLGASENYVSYMPLDIPVLQTSSEMLLDKSTKIVDSLDFEIIMDKYPQVQIFKLHKNAIDTIDWENKKKPEKVFLLFW